MKSQFKVGDLVYYPKRRRKSDSVLAVVREVSVSKRGYVWLSLRFSKAGFRECFTHARIDKSDWSKISPTHCLGLTDIESLIIQSDPNYEGFPYWRVDAK